MRHLYFYKNSFFYIFSFCISFISSKFLIKILTKHRFFQPNKNILLSLKKKQHYISMGGIAILFALNLSFFLLYLAGVKQNFGVLLLGNAYGLLGLIDDILKLSKQRSGLTIKSRLICETILAFIFIIFISSPFTNIQSLKNIVKIFWGVFIILATANAYNLTDGVDSLASTLGIYTLIFIYLFVLIGQI
jgi:phospho-N-acetylmuramoyl-pentapeptide-transferase